MYKEYADCLSDNPAVPVEMSDLDKGQEETARLAASPDNLRQEIREVRSTADHWLPFAAEAYNISPNLHDYIMVPVAIMPTDIPNRNGVAFSYSELTKFNTDVGALAYQTWKGMPTFREHQNNVKEDAKGVIFATAFRPMKRAKARIYKVIVLAGFDRSKDAYLTNQILTKDMHTYSMGALVKDYACSITGELASEHRGRAPSPYVQAPGTMPKFNTYNGHLGYLLAKDIKGFEMSAVNVPAYLSADNTEYLDLQ